jgi:hypothetical protein
MHAGCIRSCISPKCVNDTWGPDYEVEYGEVEDVRLVRRFKTCAKDEIRTIIDEEEAKEKEKTKDKPREDL